MSFSVISYLHAQSVYKKTKKIIYGQHKDVYGQHQDVPGHHQTNLKLGKWAVREKRSTDYKKDPLLI